MSQATQPPATPVDERGGNRQLRRGAIGVVGILFFVLSAQAPLTGIGGALPLAVALGNGAGAPAAYLVVGVVIAIFAVGFIAMSRHVTEEGAFYAYIGRGLGRRLGTGSAMLALWSYNTVQACMYGLYGFIVSFLFDTYLGFAPPWWVCALVTMAVVQVLGSLNIDLGARFLGVLVAAEMSILLAFALVTLFTGGGPEGLNPGASFTPSAFLAGAPGIALTFGIASMFGFESTAIYSAEAKDPARTVPRATYLAVATIALFFAFVSWMVVSHYGASQVVDAAGSALESGDGTVLLFAAISDALGPWAAEVGGVLLATSLLAGILAFHNASNRYVHSLGQTGIFPSVVARTTRQGAPYVASALQTVMALLLVMPFAVLGLDPVLTLFAWFSGVAVLGLVVLYFLTSISVVVFFRRTKLDTRPWQTLIAPVLAAVLIAALAVLVLTNFTLLIGGSVGTALPLIASVPLVVLVGVALASVRRTTPDADTPAAAANLAGATTH
ncbi:amino acid/polyamine/organocation transporter (APC superfamily) [Geodermatophilus tzadiensis]|uniref:Amino acid/polyamine/organocation transporter (APC superfamily) n=1 Tax=Geodermatophilus tzadiensis TaxID=1137988 RepID=A0A2T0TVD8_9ACTN|nr:APC family permease [Geodermatophilus tzadiensis]PRY49627.1 amino acid/polyamine/organocation transporter (APC superfamily) [Geodermatophilus tzadiensis]